jgi:arylsulfatase A-like enzyme
MARQELPVASGAIAFLIGAVLLAPPASLANAQQPPQRSCVGVSKTEYDSAYEALAYNRFGYYERTREWWRRYYWYCSLYETTPVQ